MVKIQLIGSISLIVFMTLGCSQKPDDSSVAGAEIDEPQLADNTENVQVNTEESDTESDDAVTLEWGEGSWGSLDWE